MSAGGVDAVVCTSGGLDSCVTLAEAVHAHDGDATRVAALHMSYGQRTAARERQAFDAVCDHFGVTRRLVITQPALVEIGGSALTDRAIELPIGELAEEHAGAPAKAVPITYVPFRNGQILAIACAWAEALGASAVYLGAVEEDSSGYPDCRLAFFEAFERAVDAGTRPQTKIRIVTPVLALDKAAIVRLGIERVAPLHLTWSCYQFEDRACGVCESCRLRLRGFARAGVEDPIPYV